MKTLVLVRHAKSSWNELNISDIDRQLNDRGNRDAIHMAKYLKESGVIPQSIVSSPAKRAHKTAQIFAEYLLAMGSEVKVVDDIYEADVEQLMQVMHSVDDDIDICMLVGHNPGVTEFANALISDHLHYIDSVPTTGVVILAFNVMNWKSVELNTGSFVSFITPAGLSSIDD